jgi:hypothetical protein
MRPHGTLLFQEEQSLDPRTAIVIPLFLTLISAVAPLLVHLLLVPEEAKAESRLPTLLVSLGVLVLGIPAVVIPGCIVRVITEVRTGGVFLRMFPMPFNCIGLDGTTSIRIADYNAWSYYEAKDILKMISQRKQLAAADTKGRGVLIEYANGRSILIGSGAPDRLLRAIETLRKAKG